MERQPPRSTLTYSLVPYPTLFRSKAYENSTFIDKNVRVNSLSSKEKDVLKRITLYPLAVKEAGENYSPAIIANYSYELVKEFNQFYHEHSILRSEEHTSELQSLMRISYAVFC